MTQTWTYEHGKIQLLSSGRYSATKKDGSSKLFISFLNAYIFLTQNETL